MEPAIPARAAAQSATIAFLNAYARGDASGLDATLAQLESDGHIVYVNTIPVRMLGGAGLWLLAVLLAASGLYAARWGTLIGRVHALPGRARRCGGSTGT